MADEPRGLPVPQATPGAAQNVGVAIPQIPGRLRGGVAIEATPVGLDWRVDLKISELGQAPPLDFSKTWIAAWFDSAADLTYRVALSDLSTSLPVAWGNITGKPSTFPPTLPIPSSGVTGLDAALISIDGALVSLDSRLDAAEITIATHTGQIAAHEARLDAIDIEIAAHEARLDAAEITIATHTGQIAAHEARLDAIDTEIATHEARLDGIDGKLADADRGDITTSSDFAAWTIDPNAVTDTKLRDSAALSVIGRSANSVGDPADIAAATDGHVLRRAGGVLGFGQVETAGVTDDAITNVKLANMATATFKGRHTAGAGDPEDLDAAQATSLLNAFVGDSGSGGTKGLVPPPAAGDAAAGKVLGAGGGWVSPSAAGAGQIVGSVYAQYTANADLPTTIPLDNTVPTSAEGTEIIAQAFALSGASNKARIRFNADAASAIGQTAIAAVFVDGGAAAVCTALVFVPAGGTNKLSFEFEYAPGDTASHTYRIRVGGSGGTIRLNGGTAGGFFGGTMRAPMVIEDIKV